ncbi:hypothetical protein PAXRUDRAFT_834027 [Paxillus rubicundulus Ve08.2h10]|uniref:Uncharacterized protein n=1 Tax=Paxillus rubicundulus Ve08.2h10 TaxID=930991 RepID=A0A0D0CVT7_9AGAM|nr:hypothetical protein PAXRUDRAFT_834027 [Paxillus rubicundulus Ve08.2h10]
MSMLLLDESVYSYTVVTPPLMSTLIDLMLIIVALILLSPFLFANSHYSRIRLSRTEAFVVHYNC